MSARSLRILLALVTLVVFLSCCIVTISCRPILVNISEIGICQGYDEQSWTPVDITDAFSVGDKRIYLYYYLETNVEVSLSYRWYLEDVLVYERQDSHLTAGYHFSWISPREGKQFLAGNYRVDVLMGNSVLESTEFRVEERVLNSS